ncbi:Mitogen-activated protein kinase kinase kinase [Quillaja saponaria]|uniref:mitogen-activated protein kinase kinase kinase n=1 Tax=Quillaja saponaria TaxID=32244 RepID=A0AAD7LBQ7_QUISA|nr:Mitogen-activated protein kinase kinase kinase [Quillaja saponaria]
MQDFFGSVRRSLVFRTPGGDDGGFGGLVDKIGSSIRKSRIGLFSQPSAKALPPVAKDDTPPIRWRKGEMIGCGAFGRVYMGMNLDSGELLAVKQVLIAGHSAKEKIQDNIRELEEEVKLLKNLKHPNIVRYLGTAREEDSLNILLEFVPGGSISSLLGNLGSFPESVIKMYTKQLLLGLEYLHKNGIMHRDIKGANILVDNKGCIKLADFGASKKVVELATINGAKSMKGTPYWMAPEVILQTGHSFSADIWSVGCTVIEMATGKPPWSQQYQEVAVLFHIGMTKAHPPIPEHLSVEGKDFLLKCLQEEPNLRSSAADLLQHPFVSGKQGENHVTFHGSVMEPGNQLTTSGMNSRNFVSTCTGLKDVNKMSSMRCSTVYPENFMRVGSFHGVKSSADDMCQIDDLDDLMVGASVKIKPLLASDDINKLDENMELEKSREDDFAFPFGPLEAEDDESKIRAFLDDKALELKKLQTPLYEEFFGFGTSKAADPSSSVAKFSNNLSKSRSSNWACRKLSVAVDGGNIASRRSHSKYIHRASGTYCPLQEIQPPEFSQWKDLDAQYNPLSASSSFSERQRKWKQELAEELERKREIMRHAGVGGNTASPKYHILNRQ